PHVPECLFPARQIDLLAEGEHPAAFAPRPAVGEPAVGLPMPNHGFAPVPSHCFASLIHRHSHTIASGEVVLSRFSIDPPASHSNLGDSSPLPRILDAKERRSMARKSGSFDGLAAAYPHIARWVG